MRFKTTRRPANFVTTFPLIVKGLTITNFKGLISPQFPSSIAF
jgi:hypothetical protein